MPARAQALRRHGNQRKLATLLATVAYLEARSVDDCLELLDLLMVTELIGKAETAVDKDRARRHPGLARHSARLAAAVEVLLEVSEIGEVLTLEDLWESIEAIVPRRQLRESVDAVSDMVPPPDAAEDAELRARLTERIATVTPFMKILTEVITFGSTPEGEAVLAATRSLPRLLDRRTKISVADVDQSLLTGSWKSLVLPKTGGIDRNAYVFCVLTAFHRHLKHREIYAEASGLLSDLPHPGRIVGDLHPGPDELPVPLGRPLCRRLQLHVSGQPQGVPHVPDHRQRHVIDLREVAQPLVGLQPYHQCQQALLILGPGPRPLNLGIRRGERLSQLPPRYHPAKPRIRGPIDRRHTKPPQSPQEDHPAGRSFSGRGH